MKLKLPNIIPVFPLNGVIYFPRTNLPLNIFEPRYLNLVNDCMKLNKYMGMIQQKKIGSEVYSVGCLGKVTEYKKSQDGRILINLMGVTRFEIKAEINNDKNYREFEVSYTKFSIDIDKEEDQSKKIEKISELSQKIKIFFKKNGLLLNWKEFDKLDQNQRINTLAMISPISNEEKQTILESVNIQSKVKTLSEIVEFYLYQDSVDDITIQ
jgi:Lon protease-like protein|tara:strand:- start:730 stop:1362 length:633 start_codon:yes stop_codon:yes gene_type:complete